MTRCTCQAAYERGEGSSDEDCPLHGREAQERNDYEEAA